MVKHAGFLMLLIGFFAGKATSGILDTILPLPPITEQYDYIVVGAGSAGCILANRLSATYSVLLLEKGDIPNPTTDVPALVPVMYRTENADEYLAEVQPNFGLGLTNQQVSCMRGKGLGGSSLMNYIMYVRGIKEDYDRWAAAGNPGWSYNDVVKSFKRFENTHLPNVDTSVRGVGGEMDVTELSYRSEIARAYVQGCQEYGLNLLQDYNAGTAYGVGFLQSNLRFGKRCHSERAFLHDIYLRPTLTVKSGALVTKLRIAADNSTVTGVEYTYGVLNLFASATKEVILTAGCFASAQILMLSGIGPKQHLQEMGIDVKQDLPVGQVIYDHPCFAGLAFLLNDSVSPVLATTLGDPLNWSQFLLNGTGPLTVPAMVVEAVSFVKTTVSNETLPIPDIEFLFFSAAYSTDYGLFFKPEHRISDESYAAMWKEYEGKYLWTPATMLYHPESKGYMKLRSTNPTDRPLLYANYMTDPEGKDMKTMIAAVRVAQDIAKTPSLAKYGSKLITNAVPDCKNLTFDSDDFWECQIRHLTIGLWHQTSSCKMGPSNDKEAVVDNKLRVYGMNNLRVADTSVFPRPLTAHMNIPTTMVGQKAAEFILGIV